MTSPGLLLLLLALSSLPAPAVGKGGSSGEDKEQLTIGEKLEQGVKNTLSKVKDTLAKAGIDTTWLKNNFKKLTAIFADVFKWSPLKTLVDFLFPDADKLESVYNEVKATYSKLDTVNAAVKWAEYQKAINNVEHAWIKYTHIQSQTTDEKRKDFFLTFYSQYADSALVLYQYLTAKPVNQTLGDLLAQRLRCHEADVNQEFDNLKELMCKGNELDRRYYEFKGLKTDASIKTWKEMESKSADALFRSQKQCVSNIDHYIEKDVFDLIDDTKPLEQLADEILQFLKSTYTKYNWVVVAFSTHNSKNVLTFRKSHILQGFIEVERGIVTVAVAKQVKGESTYPTKMTEPMKKCFENTVFCYNIEKDLQECNETFLGKPVSQIYTAVHTYRFIKNRTATDVKSLPEDEEDLPDGSVSPSNTQSYLYLGECGKIYEKVRLGAFMILIKSSDEIRGIDPCSKISCKNKGKCVKPDDKIPMCECPYPFYGAECEKSLEKYKKELKVGL